MSKEAKQKGVARYAPWGAVAALITSSSGVLAAEPGAAAESGILKFSHVQVVNAPMPSSLPATAPGMRVFRNSETGEMRGPSPEEMQTMAASNPPPSTDKAQFYGVNGGIGVMLDESFLQYAVVVRQPDGTLAEYCVTGADQANGFARQSRALDAAPVDGGRHDR